MPSAARWQSVVIGTRETWNCVSEPSSSGFVVVAGLLQVALGEGVLVDDDRRARARAAPRLAFSAAGFIATSTFGVSPGVSDVARRRSGSGSSRRRPSVPAGARISAGKSGSVARSFPSIAVASVKRPPTSCMPSPESPAKRTMTRSRSSVLRSTALMSYLLTVSLRPRRSYIPRRTVQARPAGLPRFVPYTRARNSSSAGLTWAGCVRLAACPAPSISTSVASGRSLT